MSFILFSYNGFQNAILIISVIRAWGYSETKFKTDPKLCLIPSNKFNLFSIFCISKVSCASLRSTWSLTCLTDCSNVDVRSKISVRVSVTESSRRPMLDSKFSRRTSIVFYKDFQIEKQGCLRSVDKSEKDTLDFKSFWSYPDLFGSILNALL